LTEPVPELVLQIGLGTDHFTEVMVRVHEDCGFTPKFSAKDLDHMLRQRVSLGD
jgi:hypothetical protein